MIFSGHKPAAGGAGSFCQEISSRPPCQPVTSGRGLLCLGTVVFEARLGDPPGLQRIHDRHIEFSVGRVKDREVVVGGLVGGRAPGLVATSSS